MIFLLLIVSSLHAQEKPRIAVIPFNPINVPKEEGEIIYKEFEAALAETGAYVLIDREEIIKLLGDGEASLFNCTSEACDVDIAKQVAAGQVIRGSLMRKSSDYVLHVQILDASNGRIVFMEQVSRAFFSQLRDALDLLAHQIAGYVAVRYGTEEIARRFTEVFVETSPSRAEIYINGIKKGISPDRIARVPVGRITISARYGNFYGEQTLDMTPETQRLLVECSEAYGTLQIRTDSNLDVYFDGRWLGKVSGGVFRNLPIGIHTLELTGQGLYWREVVVLKRNQQTTVVAQPENYGQIDYGIPEGATAEIMGEGSREVVEGYGVLPVRVGNYSIAVTGKNYQPYEQPALGVSQNETVAFEPVMEYTRDYEYEMFSEQIEELERSIEFGLRPTNTDVREMQALRQAITQSEHSFPGLLGRVEKLIDWARKSIGQSPIFEPEPQKNIAQQQQRLNTLLAQKQGLELDLATRNLKRKRRAVGGFVSFGLSMASAGAAGFLYFAANEAFRDYQTAPTQAEADEKEKLVNLLDIATIAALGTSGATLALSSVFWISRPSVKQDTEALDALEREIEMLREEIR